MRKIHLFYLGIIFLLSNAFSLNAQDNITCGFDLLHEKHMKENEVARDAMLKFESIWQDALSSFDEQSLQSFLQSEDSIYEIPLVFHIIHPNKAIGTNFNPTDQTIESVVDYLNDVFATTWPQYPSVNNGGAKINIKFVLAKRDPDCNPTTGINRINTATALSPALAASYEANGVRLSSSNGISEVQVKNLSRWDNESYYNIWVVNKIDGWSGYTSGGGVVGYAYFPGASATVDGTVIMEAFNKPGQMTLPHEIGHGLALYHTFQDGCGSQASCATTGDRVCDTDPHSQVNGCPTGTNPCTGSSWQPVVHNIMNYGTCQNRFTNQQGERMIWALQNLRSGLINSLGGVAPGGNDSILPPSAASCIPVSNPNMYRIGNSSLKIENNFHYISTNYPEPESEYYRDFNESTCLSAAYQPIALTKGEIYNVISEHYYNDQNTKVWIDYNNDGVLTENEVFFSTFGSSSNESPSTNNILYYDKSSFEIPQDAVENTVLRMRVINEYVNDGDFTSCDNLVRGRTIDFSVILSSDNDDEEEEEEEEEEEDEISISETNQIGKLSISPNPFDNYLDIRSEKNFKGVLKIINVIGQEVYVQDNLHIEAGGKFTLSFDDLPLKTNMYHLVLISDDGQVIQEKIMKN